MPILARAVGMTASAPPTAAWEGLRPIDYVAFGALAYFILIGGSDLGSLTAFRAINAIIAAVFIALWISQLRRHADTTDLLVVAALVTFLVACLLSAFPRQSFDAAGDALTYSAVFGVMRRRLTRHSVARGAITALAVCGACLAVIVFASWSQVWLSWLTRMETFPPLDAPLPVGPYRHPHVVAMLLALMTPALITTLRRRGAWIIGAIGLAFSGAVLLMAGGRGVWAAIALVVAGPLIVRLVRTPRAAILAGAALLTITLLGFASGLATPIIARLATTHTLAYRLAIWEEAFSVWAMKPLTGWGPGTFGITTTLGDFFATNTYLPRHADNAVVQALSEGGLLGIVAIALVVAAIAIGVIRVGTSWFPAIAGLALFTLMSALDNPSDSPNIVIIGAVWASMAAPIAMPVVESHETVKRRGFPSPARFITAASLLTLAAAVGSVTVASSAFDQARVAASTGDASSAREHLTRAVRFDPQMALYVRALGLYQYAAGDASRAEETLRRAVALNPADATAHRTLAVVMAEIGDGDSAISAAEAAVRRRRADPTNLLTLSAVAKRVGAEEIALDALTESLIYAPSLPAHRMWDEELAPPAEVARMASAAATLGRQRDTASPEYRVSQLWLSAIAGTPPTDYEEPLNAIDAALRCDTDAAREAMSSMSRTARHSSFGVHASLLVGRLVGDADLWNQGLTLAELRRSQLARIEELASRPENPFFDYSEDMRMYGIAPIVAPASNIVTPDPAGAMAAWILAINGRAQEAALSTPGCRPVNR